MAQSQTKIPHASITLTHGENVDLERIRRLIEETAQQATTACHDKQPDREAWSPAHGAPRTLIHKSEETGSLTFYTAPEEAWVQAGITTTPIKTREPREATEAQPSEEEE